MNETAVQSHVRLAAADVGPIMRNNVGACEDKTGRLIRYGLMNDTKALNREFKSSDLIGITPEWCYSQRLGLWRWFGVFTAYECKHSDWTWAGSEREVAQAKFHDIVTGAGGYAGFVTQPADISRIILR